VTPARIELRRVGVDFGTLAALRNVDLAVPPGSFVAVVGESGCGKSTLLRTIAGLVAPTSGTVDVDGVSPDGFRRRKQVGWMAQRAALLPWRTALENVALAQQVNPRPGRPGPHPDALLEMVGLGDFAGAYPSTLSGGMQQRVSLARTLAIGAGVWLMDEPFAALDEMTRETLADEVLDLWHRFHPTVVWVTHHLPEAVKLADRVVLLSPRPGTVTADIAVDLPRPRDETEMPFQMVVRRARAILRGEPNDEGAVLPAVGADWR
jgi:NitT/TauT family transport system ATP-binding protein